MNHAAFVRQRADIDTGWMTIGEWMMTHPPLAKRVAQLDPALGAQAGRSHRGVIRAAAIAGLILLPIVGAAAFGVTKFASLMEQVKRDAAASVKNVP